MGQFSIGGDGAEWDVFPHKTQDGRPVVVRSRTGQAALRDFAATNFMARVRCLLAPEQVNDGGMPLSTQELDEFEDRLIEALEAAGAHTYEVAVVTELGRGHAEVGQRGQLDGGPDGVAVGEDGEAGHQQDRSEFGVRRSAFASVSKGDGRIPHL